MSRYGRSILMSPLALAPKEGDPKALMFEAMKRLVGNAVRTDAALIAAGQPGLDWSTLKLTRKAQDPSATMSEERGNEHLWESVGWEADSK